MLADKWQRRDSRDDDNFIPSKAVIEFIINSNLSSDRQKWKIGGEHVGIISTPINKDYSDL